MMSTPKRWALFIAKPGSNKQALKYAIVIEHVPGSNYSAYVPDLPGCIAAGDTVEETKRLLEKAIEFHLEGMRLHGEPVPEPTTLVDYAEVAKVA
jgi:predicted RNase H-like HicB family nuclease